MTNKKYAALGAAFLLASILDAGAQTTLIRPAYQFPAPRAANALGSIQLGDSPAFVTPYIGVAGGRDDNLLLSHSNQKESALYIVSPGITLDARDANKVFTFDYQAQVAHYTSSSDDDYTDQTARAQFDMALDHRNFLRLGMAYIHGHDQRGSTDRPISNSPDKYRLSAPSVAYAFGTPGAQGRVEVYYDDADRKYLNNRDTTAASDRDTQNYGGAFYWRAMPKTYLLAEARETRIRYDLPTSLQSADEHRLFAGVSWDATAATSGTIKVGRLKRDFRSELPSDSETTWEGTLTWAPRTYSKLDFYAVRTTSEATGQGSFILTTVTGVLWSHNWNSFISTGVDLHHEHDAYQNFDRTDNTDGASLRFGYRFRRWLTLGAQYNYTKRDSSVPDAEYNRNVYLLTLTGTL